MKRVSFRTWMIVVVGVLFMASTSCQTHRKVNHKHPKTYYKRKAPAKPCDCP